MQETMVQLLGLEEQEGQATHSSVLGLPWRSAGKDAACHAGDLASVPGLGRFPGKAMVPHSSILAWRIPWGGKELDMTEQFSLSISFTLSVQSLSCVRLFATPWIAARHASLSITNSQGLLRLMPNQSVMPSSHLILCRPLLLLPPIPPSIRVFSNESALRIR